MVKTIVISLDDSEHAELVQKKGTLTWKEILVNGLK
jgi:hypothetical protein